MKRSPCDEKRISGFCISQFIAVHYSTSIIGPRRSIYTSNSNFINYCFSVFVCLVTSFAPSKEVNAWPPKLIPSSLTLDNYVQLFNRIPVGTQFRNSVIFAGFVTLFSVAFDALAAYALSRLDFRGRNVLLFVLIASMMVPYQALLIPTYKMLSSMGLIGNYNMVAMILPRAADVAGIFLLRQFFISLPRDLDNAARIDGANEFRVFWSIVLPNAKQGLFTLALFNFMNNWNGIALAINYDI